MWPVVLLSLNHHGPEVFVADGNFSIVKNITAPVSFQWMLKKNHLSQGPFFPVLIHSFPSIYANTCASSSALASSTPSHILKKHATSRSISHLLTTARLWAEWRWCITANHRQPYNTINGCKEGGPSPQEFSQCFSAFEFLILLAIVTVVVLTDTSDKNHSGKFVFQYSPTFI